MKITALMAFALFATLTLSAQAGSLTPISSDGYGDIGQAVHFHGALVAWGRIKPRD